VRQLDRQIDSQFYERTMLSRNKAAMLRKGERLRPEEAVTPEEEIKNPFVLEFLGLKDEYSESDLEGLGFPLSVETLIFTFLRDWTAVINGPLPPELLERLFPPESFR
jgi:hypothetical protein